MASELTPEDRERLAQTVRYVLATPCKFTAPKDFGELAQALELVVYAIVDALAAHWPQPAPAGEVEVAAIRARLDQTYYLPWRVSEHGSTYMIMQDGGSMVIAYTREPWAANAIVALPADIAALLARVAALEAERDGWRDEYERVRADRDSYADGVFNALSELEGYKHDADCYRELIALLAPHACTCGANVPDASKHKPLCRYAACVCTVDGTVPDGVDTDAGSDDEEGPDSEY